MKSVHQLILVLILVALAVVTANQCGLRLSLGPNPVIIDGKLNLGLAKDQALAALLSLGYQKGERTAELKEDEIRYVRTLADGQSVENFLRVTLSESGSVDILSGSPRELAIGKTRLVFGDSTITNVKDALGEPSWEKHVGGGTTGLCYQGMSLYLTVRDGYLTGFSLGRMPARP